MKIFLTTFFCCLLAFGTSAQKQSKQSTIYVDNHGVMRWSGTRQEASFYGVNYTLPFAHAYRAIGYLDKSRKESIDKDVYHFARLGFNAYRIHIWDVEISNRKGDLLENDHLDLFDYLVFKLKERNIKILITTMTNFGNGYPERNEATDGFSNYYDKCNIHSNPEAIAAQQTYIQNFIKHVNPYTGKAFKDDPAIVGFEINNEPCHADTPQQTKKYIDTMLSAIKKTGNTKPIFYNVSHNMQQVESYFASNIQGTTYQWYPIGLVAGRTRKGNFLPYVSSYHIPFANVKGFNNKARAVYEFDPADIMYSYMYPAMARTFRTSGFQWITQFAYDPMDLAWANTEYQTHYMNLAYTPNKAISMKIAAEITRTMPRNKSYGIYPRDTIFDDFRVSYSQDLSEMNSPEKFFYSNNTTTQPVNPEKLEAIAGCGSSPLVHYEGSGAYFLDKLEYGVWRLEVMPDAIVMKDPFEKTSLKKEVVTIAWNQWDMQINLPELGGNFGITAINKGNSFKGMATGTTIAIKPGVYLLQRTDYTPKGKWNNESEWHNIHLGEFAAPVSRIKSYSVVHQAAKCIEKGKSLQIEAQITGPDFPDSVIIYTDKISFWSQSNPSVKMKRTHGYIYVATIPTKQIVDDVFKYNISVCKNNKTYTSPANTEGSPLDWDYYQNQYWETAVVTASSPVELVRIADDYSGLETASIPETAVVKRNFEKGSPTSAHSIKFDFRAFDFPTRFFIRKYIKNEADPRKESLAVCKYVCIDIRNSTGIDSLRAGFITSNGFTYSANVPLTSPKGIIRIPVSDMKQTVTALLPSPYPTFLERYFIPDTQLPFSIREIETLEVSTGEYKNKEINLEVGSIWLE